MGMVDLILDRIDNEKEGILNFDAEQFREDMSYYTDYDMDEIQNEIDMKSVILASLDPIICEGRLYVCSTLGTVSDKDMKVPKWLLDKRQDYIKHLYAISVETRQLRDEMLNCSKRSLQNFKIHG